MKVNLAAKLLRWSVMKLKETSVCLGKVTGDMLGNSILANVHRNFCLVLHLGYLYCKQQIKLEYKVGSWLSHIPYWRKFSGHQLFVFKL